LIVNKIAAVVDNSSTAAVVIFTIFAALQIINYHMRRLSTWLATTCLLTLSVIKLSAAPVDSTRAKQLALSFFSSLSNTSSEQLLADGVSVVYLAYAEDSTNIHTNTVCFYAVNVGRKGFVMLSGDDRIKPILGYSYESTFKTKDMPENVQGWLKGLQKEISSALAMEDFVVAPEITEQWNHLSEIGAAMSVIVQPLLQTTWDQEVYYNQYCPADANAYYSGYHVYTGCAATAMAQVIRYWEYPFRGVGSHSYEANFASIGYGDYGTQSANFETTTYDYRLMPAYLDANSSYDQIDAVATLLYHCGVSVDMMYSVNGSGAYLSSVADALHDYFAYSSGISYVHKINYSDDGWKTMIKNELQNQRPVLYEGNGSLGGHAFVLDGYNDANYFHINWGWSGDNNGYFSLSSLTPSIYDFSSEQGAIIGIQP
jgi:hypothetical protein